MVTTQDVRFPVEGGQMRAALALPDEPDGTVPGLLVLHELFGLNDDIRRIAARFAENGYAALAPDLYSVGPPRPICILRTMQAMNSGSGRVFDDLEAGQRWLAEQPQVDGSRVGVAGFCMGGSFAILHAVRAPVGAAAAFYARVPRTVEELDGICPGRRRLRRTRQDVHWPASAPPRTSRPARGCARHRGLCRRRPLLHEPTPHAAARAGADAACAHVGRLPPRLRRRQLAAHADVPR